MPKVEVDYSKTIIYKIVCKDTEVDYVYVGHTTNLNQRRSSHKHSTTYEKSRKYGYKLYETIRENGGFDNWLVVEVEKYPCNDFNEALKRERYWVEYFQSNNQRIPSRGQKEYQMVNKEKIQEYKKQYAENNKEKINLKWKKYYEKNKEKLSDYSKQYREENKEKISIRKQKYNKENKEKLYERGKLYREKNADVIKERKREYYQKNKKKINERVRLYEKNNADVIKEKRKEYYQKNKEKINEKTTCICGSILSISYLPKHIKSLKHKAFLETSN